MALERPSEHFGPLNAEADTVVFDGRQSRLWNSSALRDTAMRFFAGRNSFI